MPTAISTKAFEMASLLPSYISSGVSGIPSLLSISATLSSLGLAWNAPEILFKLDWAFLKPWSWAAGSLLLILFSYEAYCSALF